jgi:hypothetical protein
LSLVPVRTDPECNSELGFETSKYSRRKNNFQYLQISKAAQVVFFLGFQYNTINEVTACLKLETLLEVLMPCTSSQPDRDLYKYANSAYVTDEKGTAWK